MTTPSRWRTTRFATIGLLVSLLHVSATQVSVAAIYEVPPGDTAALISAINVANTDAAADVINLRGGVYLLTLADNDGVAGPNALPVITTSITVNGRGSTIAGSGMFRFFHVADGGSLLLTRVTLRDGDTDYGGGAIRNEGALAITNSTFRSNQGGEGGAILNNGVRCRGLRGHTAGPYLRLTGFTSTLSVAAAHLSTLRGTSSRSGRRWTKWPSGSPRDSKLLGSCRL